MSLRNKTWLTVLGQGILLVLSLVPVWILVLGLLGAAVRYTDVPVLLEELTVEAGSRRLDPRDFRTDPADPSPRFSQSLTRAQLNTPGSYPVRLICGGREYAAVVHVRDTVAPIAQVKNLTSQGRRPQPEEFLEQIEDVTEVTVCYAREPVLTVNGDQKVILLLTDTSGNTAAVEAVLTVDLDVTAPQIHGVAPIVVYQGDAVAYRQGITVTDDRDANPVLSVDASQVDLSAPGEYLLIYTAADASGNMVREETTVTVRAKQPDYVSVEEIYQEADKILAQIITEGMTRRQQARAVYDWVRRVGRYVNHSDKSDDLQGAYQMFTEQEGDCFNYFAACKLLLQRLGIDTIDVRKVKNYSADSDHYWLLVSLDGESYYHFDPVPRVGDSVEFFLVTDAFLDDYSRRHNNCFNRDQSLYPATPS